MDTKTYKVTIHIFVSMAGASFEFLVEIPFPFYIYEDCNPLKDIGGAMAFEVVPAALEGYNLTSIVYNHNTNTRKLKI